MPSRARSISTHGRRIASSPTLRRRGQSTSRLDAETRSARTTERSPSRTSSRDTATRPRTVALSTGHDGSTTATSRSVRPAILAGTGT